MFDGVWIFVDYLMPESYLSKYSIDTKVKLAAVVEDIPKAPFSIATSVVYWPLTRPNMPFQRRRSAYAVDVGELGWQYGTGLKSHGIVTNWCTGREWPVNCMTVISTRWWSNMPFQRRWKCIFRWPVMGRYWVGVELLYNSVRQEVS